MFTSSISHMNIASNLTQLVQHTKGTVDVANDRYMGVLPFYHIVSEKKVSMGLYIMISAQSR
jgi:long-subunit acyl-CoA synthetase (AMP-forming)